MVFRLHPLAGKPAPGELLIDIAKLERDYYERKPDLGSPYQLVSFGTSGHRGASANGTFTEAHILAITQAICDYRTRHGITGPVFIGKDTHALSSPAQRTAIEVLAANGIDTFIQRDDGFTPTPALSLAILTYNRGRKDAHADGIGISPSHNPPTDGGFKYTPPNGGPADTDITAWIQHRANQLLQILNHVKRLPLERALRAATTHNYDFVMPYVEALAAVIDMEAIRAADVKIGIDPLGGATVGYWNSIKARYGLNLTIVNPHVDPTFRFMTLDYDGKIRMDCSSPFAMAGLVMLKDEFDVAFATDPDADRHGIVTPSAGLMNPNHFLAVAIRYLLTHRPQWPQTALIGKTIVSTSLIDRVAADLGRALCEVPVGFKWFAQGLFDGSLCFAGDESAAACFLRHDGSTWVTEKDGLLLGLLAAEITARTGKHPGTHYTELTAKLGTPYYGRIDTPASPEQRAAFKRLTPEALRANQLAGEPITAKLTRAPGNAMAIGGLKVVTHNGWFVARPSGTENLYKLYAESFRNASHLDAIFTEAQTILQQCLFDVPAVKAQQAVARSAEIVAEERIEQTRSEGSPRLDLSGLGLATLPGSVGRLTHLQQLVISNNRLTTLPDSLFLLSRLHQLIASDNQLITLPENLGHLTHLETLDVSRNELIDLPTSIGEMRSLQHLSVSKNRLTSLPESIGQLSELRGLDCYKNKLAVLPETIGQLTKLQGLYAHDNELTSLPKSLLQLKQLQRLFLQNNATLGLPPEVLGPTYKQVIDEDASPASPSTILEFYFRTRKATWPIGEAKLILVGRGGAGKTCLVNRLLHNQFDPAEKRTDGICILTWRLALQDEPVQLNVWDFGGQEIMHATHQFFLTKRSVYLVVLSGREGTEDYDADYWLKYIESFGAESPVIVVLNKIKSHRFTVNKRQLREKYPAIREFVETDCCDGTGIDTLRDVVKQVTDKLEHLRDPFPTAWFGVKQELSSMKDNYITFQKYRAICDRQRVTNQKDQNELVEFLHNLGIVLNFRDDLRLTHTHVLKPSWITEGVYNILNAELLSAKHGVLSAGDLKQILDPETYPVDCHEYLVDLMTKFDLCLELYESEPRQFLVPELLTKEQPEVGQWESLQCIGFQYRYRILPEGVLPRFIVRSHSLSEGRHRWRSGVMLAMEEAEALVKADLQERHVTIWVRGEAQCRQRLMAVIRQDFEQIQSDFKNLGVEEFVQPPDSRVPWVEYRRMVALEQNGERVSKERVNEAIVELSVEATLDGLESKRERYRRAAAPKQISEGPRPVKLVVSYSHRDKRLREKLDTQLKLLARSALIANWDDTQIIPGTKWDEEIHRQFSEADVVLLLISDDFLASDYIMDEEVPLALDRHAKGQARVVPILLKDSRWRKTPLKHLQVLPKGARPIVNWDLRDSGWRSVGEGLEAMLQKQVVERVQMQGKGPPPQRGVTKADDAQSKSPA
jgi:alpha-D-glucose phosphate-specific phosphoglucomutase